MKRRTPKRLAVVAASLAVAVAIGSSARATPRPPEGQDRPPTHHVVQHDHDTDAADTDGHDGRTGPAGVDPLAEANLDVLRGEEAVEELIESDTLDAVAEDVGIAPAELIDEFREDRSLFLTDTGLVGYVDAFPLEDTESSTGAVTVAPPDVDVGALSSMPSSTRTLYLDFDGHLTSGTDWADIDAPEPISSLPYACAAGVRADVNSVIFEVWQRVSEDFAPFGVNVTTADPGPQAIRRSSSADQVFGQRVVISPTNWVGAGVLGVALLNSFGSDGDSPAFVFAAAASARVIAEAVSHEAGHTFGLKHDGLTAEAAALAAEYYNGHGVWAPIMGRSISPSSVVTQWSRGEYGRANNLEDDIDRIRSFVGVAEDDHGDTAATASPSPAGAGAVGRIGVGDLDVFAFDVVANAPLSVELRPAAPWSNLYAAFTLRSSDGSVIETARPSTPPSWSASVQLTSLPPGRYTIEVRPTSYLTPLDGFSLYGSLGRYRLAVNSDVRPPLTLGAATAYLQASRLGVGPAC